MCWRTDVETRLGLTLTPDRGSWEGKDHIRLSSKSWTIVCPHLFCPAQRRPPIPALTTGVHSTKAINCCLLTLLRGQPATPPFSILTARRSCSSHIHPSLWEAPSRSLPLASSTVSPDRLQFPGAGAGAPAFLSQK